MTTESSDAKKPTMPKEPAKLAEWARKHDPEMTVDANKRKGTKILARECEHVHVEIVQPSFNQTTGKPITKPYVQKFSRREWALFLKERGGYQIHEKKEGDEAGYIHLPDGLESVKQYEARLDKEWEAEQQKLEKELKKQRQRPRRS